MDSLRDDEEREINHHGEKINAVERSDEMIFETLRSTPDVSPNDLKHRREDVEVKARKAFYAQMEKTENNKKKILACKKIGRFYIPLIVLCFTLCFWIFGLSQI